MLAANKKSIRNFVVAIACSLTIAIPAAVNAQSSPLTVQPSTGRVGIGNTNPQQPLDVTGNANVTGNVTAGGFIGDGSQLTNLPGGATGALDKVTANTTVSGTAEATLYSFSVPGGTLGTNNMLRLTIQITALALDSTNNLRLRFKYGGTTLASVQITNSTEDTASGKGKVTVVLAGDGATNTQLGTLVFYNDAGLGTHLAQGTSAINSTTAQTLVVTADFGSSNSITLGQAILEKIS